MRAPWKSTGAWAWRTASAPRACRRRPMDVYIVLDLTGRRCCACPIRPSRRPRPTSAPPTTARAARALPAHFAIHARAAAQVRAEPAGRDHALRLRNLSRFEESAEGVGVDREIRRRHDAPSAAPIWSAATAARARCAGSLASGCAAKPTCCGFVRRSTAAMSCSTAFRSATARARPPLSCGRGEGELPDHAGLDQALDPARTADTDEEMIASSKRSSASR